MCTSYEEFGNIIVEKRSTMNKTFKMMAAATLLTAVFWNQPVYRRYTVNSQQRLTGLKIIFISDLHNTSYGQGQQKLLQMIHQEAPDLLFFGGDIADEKSPEYNIEVLLEKLKGHYPMYYISGNHEYWMKNTSHVFKMFQDKGLVMLMNKAVTVETDKGKISLLGLTDPDSNLDLSDKALLTQALATSYEPSQMPHYKILLSHRPEHIDVYRKYDFDLILSGHAHGGQVRIPFLLNGLYAPNQGFLPKYAGGHYQLDQVDFIVSRGLSFRAKLPRIMNPPELVVITFD